MTTYSTGNPVGSPDPRDLYDNAENLDEAINSTSDEWTDRLGRTRFTIEGVTNLATDLGTAAYRDTVGAGDVYAREGILGTVSQSSGVPTGAIIERGSNANGEYVKFADGTLTCVRLIILDVADYTGTTYDLGTFSYPAGFVGDPAVSATVSVNSTVNKFQAAYYCTALGRSDGWGRVHLRSFNSAEIDTSDPQSMRISLTAIWRWY